MSIGLYIHIPFCIKKCNYCDFVSYPIGDVQADSYLHALEGEMELYHQLLKADDLSLETLYIGGGTPTCLTGPQLRRVLQASRLFFDWLPEIEVTVEANPGTLDIAKLEVLQEEGVNRLSLGVQSFSPGHLARMGRPHGIREVKEAVQMVREAGIKNLSLDLIYGLPEQTLQEWRHTLSEALFLEPEHLSAYGLKIETGTPWGHLEVRGELEPADQDLARLMYDEVQEQCKKRGYRHYEISNFAKPGFEARHNLRYWHNHSYLGLGVAAASYMNQRRWTNVSLLKDYETLLAGRKRPVAEEWSLDLTDEMAETVLLGLRTLDGVALDRFQERFGIDLQAIFAGPVEKMMAAGLLTIDNQHLKLTPAGLPVANLVFEAFV